MAKIGMHISDSPEDINYEIDRILDMGANTVQLFVFPDYKDKSVYDVFKKNLQSKKVSCVVHASYMINLAANWDEYSWWIKQFIEEIELANKIGSKYIIVHMGKQMQLTREQAYNNMYTALLYVHNQTKEFRDTKIVLETSTGQGSELCYKIEDFAYFFKKFSLHKNIEVQDRFRVCLDTCHIFSAGYDLRTKGAVDMYLDAFEELIGLKYVATIHLNDSKKDLGSNVDRHENLGQGFIGTDGLKYFADFFKKLKVPIILETPFKFHGYEIKKFLS